MKEVNKPYSEWQQAHYRLAYSTTPSKRVRATHYCVYYNSNPITNGKSYALCQVDLKEFKTMAQFPDKSLLQIKPYKG